MKEKSKNRRGISELFIQRPITTTLVMVGIVLFGFIGYEALPVSDLPTVDYPTINVSASLPGANPETMAASVASCAVVPGGQTTLQFSTTGDTATMTLSTGTQVALQRFTY